MIPATGYEEPTGVFMESTDKKFINENISDNLLMDRIFKIFRQKWLWFTGLDSIIDWYIMWKHENILLYTIFSDELQL